MEKKSQQIILGILGGILLLGPVIYINSTQSDLPVKQISYILIPVLLVLTFINTDLALMILILSMLLSPEINISDIPKRSVVVRVDDILLFIVFFSWLGKMGVNKQLGLLRHTAINKPIILYILVCVGASALGIARGTIRSPRLCIFVILKYIEYFMLFFMVTNNIRSKEQVKVFTFFLLLTCIIVSMIGVSQIGNMDRTTAPFESEGGEPNTFGGYLVLLTAVSAGVFIHARRLPWKILAAVTAVAAVPPFLFSLSRGSYLAFIVAFLILVLLSKRFKPVLLLILVAGALLVPLVLPDKVTERITETFTPGKLYRPLGQEIYLDESASARVETWEKIIHVWKKRPVLGYGVSGVGVVDSQYPRVLGETGLVGFIAFLFMLYSVLKNSWKSLISVEQDWEQGIIIGFIAGFMGLVAHATSANTFIVRIMEPFWFFTAIVVCLPELRKDNNTEEAGSI